MSARADATARTLFGFQPGDRVRLNHEAVCEWVTRHGAYLGIPLDWLTGRRAGRVFGSPRVWSTGDPAVVVAWDCGHHYYVLAEHLDLL